MKHHITLKVTLPIITLHSGKSLQYVTFQELLNIDSKHNLNEAPYCGTQSLKVKVIATIAYLSIVPSIDVL